MSTKNLARTVIEGGRAAFNTQERRRSRQRERVRVRILCRDAAALINPDDQTRSYNTKQLKVTKHHSDKLSAGMRWLRSQIGRPWNKVRSELFKMLNPRTLQGHHLLRDHLLREVERAEFSRIFGSNYGFYVDGEGLLCLHDKNQWSKRNKRHGFSSYSPELRKWFGVNRVMDLDHQQFWMIPTKVENTRCGDPRHCVTPFKEHVRETERQFFVCRRDIPCMKMEYNQAGEYGYYYTNSFYTCPRWTEYRQRSPLTAEQKQFWFSLSESTRQTFQIFTAAQTEQRWRDSVRKARAA